MATQVKEPELFTNGTEDNSKASLLRRVDCPPDLFGEGRYVVVRPVKMKTWRIVNRLDPRTNEDDLDEFNRLIMPAVVEWNLIDPYTDEPLPQFDEPDVFDELTASQQRWVVEQLRGNVGN